METLLAQLPLLLLVSCRVAGVAFSSPVFSNRFMPAQLRGAFTFLLALLILPGARAVPWATSETGMLAACALEVLVGLVIGFTGHLVFAVAQMAGGLVDLQLGYSLAQVIDPVSGRTDPLLGSLFQTLVLVVYLAVDGHHQLIGVLAGSYTLVPAGGLVVEEMAPLQVVNLFGQLLVAAVQMVLPLLAVSLLVSVALAGLSRAVPQLQVFVLGLGTQTLVGLSVLWLSLPYWLGFLQRLFARGDAYLIHVLQQLGRAG